MTRFMMPSKRSGRKRAMNTFLAQNYEMACVPGEPPPKKPRLPAKRGRGTATRGGATTAGTGRPLPGTSHSTQDFTKPKTVDNRPKRLMNFLVIEVRKLDSTWSKAMRQGLHSGNTRIKVAPGSNAVDEVVTVPAKSVPKPGVKTGDVKLKNKSAMGTSKGKDLKKGAKAESYQSAQMKMYADLKKKYAHKYGGDKAKPKPDREWTAKCAADDLPGSRSSPGKSAKSSPVKEKRKKDSAMKSQLDFDERASSGVSNIEKMESGGDKSEMTDDTGRHRKHSHSESKHSRLESKKKHRHDSHESKKSKSDSPRTVSSDEAPKSSKNRRDSSEKNAKMAKDSSISKKHALAEVDLFSSLDKPKKAKVAPKKTSTEKSAGKNTKQIEQMRNSGEKSSEVKAQNSLDQSSKPVLYNPKKSWLAEATKDQHTAQLSQVDHTWTPTSKDLIQNPARNCGVPHPAPRRDPRLSGATYTRVRTTSDSQTPDARGDSNLNPLVGGVVPQEHDRLIPRPRSPGRSPIQGLRSPPFHHSLSEEARIGMGVSDIRQPVRPPFGAPPILPLMDMIAQPSELKPLSRKRNKSVSDTNPNAPPMPAALMPRMETPGAATSLSWDLNQPRPQSPRMSSPSRAVPLSSQRSASQEYSSENAPKPKRLLSELNEYMDVQMRSSTSGMDNIHKRSVPSLMDVVVPSPPEFQQYEGQGQGHSNSWGRGQGQTHPSDERMTLPGPGQDYDCKNTESGQTYWDGKTENGDDDDDALVSISSRSTTPSRTATPESFSDLNRDPECSDPGSWWDPNGRQTAETLKKDPALDLVAAQLGDENSNHSSESSDIDVRAEIRKFREGRRRSSDSARDRKDSLSEKLHIDAIEKPAWGIRTSHERESSSVPHVSRGDVAGVRTSADVTSTFSRDVTTSIESQREMEGKSDVKLSSKDPRMARATYMRRRTVSSGEPGDVTQLNVNVTPEKPPVPPDAPGDDMEMSPSPPLPEEPEPGTQPMFVNSSYPEDYYKSQLKVDTNFYEPSLMAHYTETLASPASTDTPPPPGQTPPPGITPPGVMPPVSEPATMSGDLTAMWKNMPPPMLPGQDVSGAVMGNDVMPGVVMGNDVMPGAVNYIPPNQEYGQTADCYNQWNMGAPQSYNQQPIEAQNYIPLESQQPVTDPNQQYHTVNQFYNNMEMTSRRYYQTTANEYRPYGRDANQFKRAEIERLLSMRQVRSSTINAVMICQGPGSYIPDPDDLTEPTTTAGSSVEMEVAPTDLRVSEGYQSKTKSKVKLKAGVKKKATAETASVETAADVTTAETASVETAADVTKEANSAEPSKMEVTDENATVDVEEEVKTEDNKMETDSELKTSPTNAELKSDENTLKNDIPMDIKLEADVKPVVDDKVETKLALEVIADTRTTDQKPKVKSETEEKTFGKINTKTTDQYLITKCKPRTITRRRNDVYITPTANYEYQIEKCRQILRTKCVLYIHALGQAVNRALEMALELTAEANGCINMSVNTNSEQVQDELLPVLEGKSEPEIRGRATSSVHITLSNVDFRGPVRVLRRPVKVKKVKPIDQKPMRERCQVPRFPGAGPRFMRPRGNFCPRPFPPRGHRYPPPPPPPPPGTGPRFRPRPVNYY